MFCEFAGLLTSILFEVPLLALTSYKIRPFPQHLVIHGAYYLPGLQKYRFPWWARESGYVEVSLD